MIGESIDGLMPGDGGARYRGDMPDLSKHNNWMARCLTPAIWNKYKDAKTPSGFSFQDCIRTGIMNEGHPHIYTVGTSVLTLVSSVLIVAYRRCLGELTLCHRDRLRRWR